MVDGKETNDRRGFLKDVSAALVVSSTAAASQADAEPAPVRSDKFQPEIFWKDRIEPPDDGKTLGWFIDTRRCFGCHGCEVSCKSENNVPLGNFIRQTFYQDEGEYPKVVRMFLPMACQHCEDAPCIKACPCGALYKEKRWDGCDRLQHLLRPRNLCRRLPLRGDLHGPGRQAGSQVPQLLPPHGTGNGTGLCADLSFRGAPLR